MLTPGRLPLTEAEHHAVEKLLAENDGAAVSLTRRDPGETGPLLVYVDDVSYLIEEEGRRRKLKAN